MRASPASSVVAVSASFFIIKKKYFSGYFNPEKFFYITKINSFRGELTDISAKKEALVAVRTVDATYIHKGCASLVNQASRLNRMLLENLFLIICACTVVA